MKTPSLIVIAHNMRSTHNVGSLLRTAEGLGIDKVILTGYTPYPRVEHDTRLPHISEKVSRAIQKTALGAESMVAWSYQSDITATLEALRLDGFKIIALEQAPDSTSLVGYMAPPRVAILLGNEVEGVDMPTLQAVDEVLEIPMLGSKESFNVIQAAAMALYHIRYVS